MIKQSVKHSVSQWNQIISREWIARLGDSLSLMAILAFLVGFFAFNERIMQDHRLLTATFLLVTGVGLLSWMTPASDDGSLET